MCDILFHHLLVHIFLETLVIELMSSCNSRYLRYKYIHHDVIRTLLYYNAILCIPTDHVLNDTANDNNIIYIYIGTCIV